MLRWLLCGVAIVGTGLQAHAADLDDSVLRGSSTVITAPGGTRWDGVYVGAHVGMSVPGADFANNTADVTTLVMSSGAATATATPLGTQDSTSIHYGGFVGYNAQWDGAVISGEGTYNWINKSLTATNTVTGVLGPAGGALNYSAAGSVTGRLIDYGTLRVRGGWATDSFFMPYATFGLAIGRMDVTRTAVVTPIPAGGVPAPAPFTVTNSLNDEFGFGFAAGVGVDFCLTQNFFLRTEYEYVQFPDFQGLNVHMHNVRVGAAMKF